MWFTLLVMAVAVSFEPFRIGLTVLMLNRPRPLLQLFAFLCGGFAMGVTVGLVVLFVVRSAVAPAQFTLPRVQMVIGVLALLIAAVLAVRPARPRSDGDRLSMWARRLADGHSLWVAAVAGLGIALPSIDYLAALAVIAASGTAATIADRCASDLQRSGVHVHRDPAAGLSGGAGADTGGDDVAARLAPVAFKTRRGGPVGSRRMRAFGRRNPGLVDRRRALAALTVHHVLEPGEHLRQRIGGTAEGGLGRRCGDGRRVIAVVRVHRDRRGQGIVRA